jgi:hypothetical protein
MTRTKPILVAVLFGLIGLWGAGTPVMGQADSLATALQQYEAKANKKVDRNKADDMVAWARWCYQNEKPAEANAIALEGLQKAPDDLRLKYLAYALSGAATTVGPDGIMPVESVAKSATISKEETEKIYKAEGELTMRKFKDIQNNVLIPRCGKCHGGGNDKAKAKWSLVKDADERRMLAENFRTINPFINRDARMDSKILVVPSRSPENVHTQVFKGAADAAYKNLVRWIMTLEAPKIFAP